MAVLSQLLLEARRALQQWEYDRRVKYFYQRPRPVSGESNPTDPVQGDDLDDYAAWFAAL